MRKYRPDYGYVRDRQGNLCHIENGRIGNKVKEVESSNPYMLSVDNEADDAWEDSDSIS